ncbi:hypothetical protein RYX36_013508 [Vicia faba]
MLFKHSRILISKMTVQQYNQSFVPIKGQHGIKHIFILPFHSSFIQSVLQLSSVRHKQSQHATTNYKGRAVRGTTKLVLLFFSDKHALRHDNNTYVDLCHPMTNMGFEFKSVCHVLNFFVYLKV